MRATLSGREMSFRSIGFKNLCWRKCWKRKSARTTGTFAGTFARIAGLRHTIFFAFSCNQQIFHPPFCWIHNFYLSCYFQSIQEILKAWSLDLLQLAIHDTTTNSLATTNRNTKQFSWRSRVWKETNLAEGFQAEHLETWRFICSRSMFSRHED